MNNGNSIKDRITILIKVAKIRNQDLRGEDSLSQSYPEGQTAYFKKRRFDLKVKMYEDSMIGKNWIDQHCKPVIFNPEDGIFNTDWIQGHTETFLNPKYKQNEDEVFRQLEIFINQCVLLEHYDYLICEGEKKTKTKNSKKSEPSMVRAKAFCIALMQQSGKVNFLKGNALKRNEIMTYAKEKWGKNGRTIYNECLNIITEKNPINKFYKEDNPKEYEIGLKLYKEMFPD